MTIIRTAADLKRAVIASGGHFFDCRAMRFFGDTMVNYYVPQAGMQAAVFGVVDSRGQTRQCIELKRKCPVKGGCAYSSYFDQITFDHVVPAKGSIIH